MDAGKIASAESKSWIKAITTTEQTPPGTGYNSRQNEYFSGLWEKQQKGLVWGHSWLGKSDDFKGRSYILQGGILLSYS